MLKEEEVAPSAGPFDAVLSKANMIQQRYQSFLDSLTPIPAARWTATVVFFVVYFIRVFTLQGWYIVTYALGIYLLNLFLAFLTPKFDPALDDLDANAGDMDGGALPTKMDEEFKPFIRRLPEFKFWHASTRAVLIALFCTFFKFFDIPVFWPILLMYFVVLFTLTMRRQIAHMIKYKYLPFNVGKKRYSATRRNSS